MPGADIGGECVPGLPACEGKYSQICFMEDISKDVLARLEELSGRVAALEREILLLKGKEDPLLGEGVEETLTDFVLEDFEGLDVVPESESRSEQVPEPEPAPGPSLESAVEIDLPVPGAVTKLPQEEFGLFGEIEPKEEKAPKRKRAEASSPAEAWRSDMPGTPLRNIRSGISLNDRVMFINGLFRKDSALFQDTLERLNEMNSLAAAVKYLKGTFPEWAWGSEMVYRFMMCVRRKLR